MNKISIGIVDDHPAIGRGIAAELKAIGHYDILFTLSDKNLILENLRKNLPDVFIMDVVMPGSSGIDTFKEALQVFPEVKILAYTGLNSPLLVELLMKSGVKGYVNKEDSIDELNHAIMSVYKDKIYLPANYHYLLKKYHSSNTSAELSKREIEILVLIVDGKKTSDIAEALFISVNTVETHRKNIFQKLNVTNIAELIKEAINLGYAK
jgi:DNA-binding NarL/FixJ family response regulator